jgi:hypothetical protein
MNELVLVMSTQVHPLFCGVHVAHLYFFPVLCFSFCLCSFCDFCPMLSVSLDCPSGLFNIYWGIIRTSSFIFTVEWTSYFFTFLVAVYLYVQFSGTSGSSGTPPFLSSWLRQEYWKTSSVMVYLIYFKKKIVSFSCMMSYFNNWLYIICWLDIYVFIPPL